MANPDDREALLQLEGSGRFQPRSRESDGSGFPYRLRFRLGQLISLLLCLAEALFLLKLLGDAPTTSAAQRGQASVNDEQRNPYGYASPKPQAADRPWDCVDMCSCLGGAPAWFVAGGGGTGTSASRIATRAVSYTARPQFGQKRLSFVNSCP